MRKGEGEKVRKGEKKCSVFRNKIEVRKRQTAISAISAISAI